MLQNLWKFPAILPRWCHIAWTKWIILKCKQIPIFKRNVEQGHAVHQLLGWLWRQSGFGVAGQHKCPHICLIFVPYLQNKVSMTTSHLLLLSLATHGEFMGQQIEVSWASPWSTFMFRGLAHEGSWASWQHMECLYVQTSGGGGEWGLSLSWLSKPLVSKLEGLLEVWTESTDS